MPKKERGTVETTANATQIKTGVTRARRNATTSAYDTGGVVAYTKGSRLKDAAVRDAVDRVLKKS